jgi:hypothetical protein
MNRSRIVKVDCLSSLAHFSVHLLPNMENRHPQMPATRNGRGPTGELPRHGQDALFEFPHFEPGQFGENNSCQTTLTPLKKLAYLQRTRRGSNRKIGNAAGT